MSALAVSHAAPPNCGRQVQAPVALTVPRPLHVTASEKAHTGPRKPLLHLHVPLSASAATPLPLHENWHLAPKKPSSHTHWFDGRDVLLRALVCMTVGAQISLMQSSRFAHCFDTDPAGSQSLSISQNHAAGAAKASGDTLTLSVAPDALAPLQATAPAGMSCTNLLLPKLTVAKPLPLLVPSYSPKNSVPVPGI